MEGPGSSEPRFRSRRVMLVATLAALLVAAPVAALLVAYRLASGPACAEIPREDLTLREMGTLRSTIESYKRDPSRPLDLTARQASFLLREEFQLLAWFTTEVGSVAGQAVVDEDGRCWNLVFRGTVAVDGGRATVIPEELRVGDLPLGWLVGGRAFDVGPERLPQERARELLAHLASVRIEDGRVLVRVDDPSWIR